MTVLDEIVQDQLRTDLPVLATGDTVKVSAKVVEGIFSAAWRHFIMSDEPHIPPIKLGPTLVDEVGGKAARKLKARRRGAPGVWFGLGMMGLIGWSVAVPTLLGAALGLWLDAHHPGAHSWTLALLVAGLMIGCLNAWHWVAKEEQAMRDEREEDNE